MVKNRIRRAIVAVALCVLSACSTLQSVYNSNSLALEMLVRGFIYELAGEGPEAVANAIEIAAFIGAELLPAVDSGLVVTYGDAARMILAKASRTELTQNSQRLLNDFVTKLASQTQHSADQGLIELSAPVELRALVREALDAAELVASGK